MFEEAADGWRVLGRSVRARARVGRGRAVRVGARSDVRRRTRPGDGDRDLRRARRPGPAGVGGADRAARRCRRHVSGRHGHAIASGEGRRHRAVPEPRRARRDPDRGELPVGRAPPAADGRGMGIAARPPAAGDRGLAERHGGRSGVRGRGGGERSGIRRAAARHARHAVRAGDRGGAAVPGAARRWGTPARGARGHHGRRGGARGRGGRRGRPARRDARGRPPGGRARRARGRRRGTRAVPSGGRPARPADAREDGRVGAERDRTDRGCGHGRLEARRRADPGAPRRRRGRGLHPDARPDHGACARGRGGGARAARSARSSSTARRSRSVPTDGRVRSRRPRAVRRAAETSRPFAERCRSRRSSSTCSTWTGRT